MLLHFLYHLPQSAQPFHLQDLREELRSDPEYAKVYFREAQRAFREGEPEVGASMMTDLIAAGVRFSVLRPRHKEAAQELVEA